MIIVVVQVGAVKIYVAVVEEALREKKERGVQNRMKLLVYQKRKWCFSEFHLAPPLPPPFEC